MQAATNPPPRREWSILYYIGNNYKPLAGYVANEMDHIAATIGTDDRVAIVGQKGSFETGGDTTRFVVLPPRPGAPVPQGTALPSNVQVVAQLGKTDLGDAKSLYDFLHWGTTHYPAEHYMVVMGGDGGAWWGALPDSCFHETLTMPKLKQVFEQVSHENGQKFDVVDFDCCLLSCAEAADALKNSARFVHASEEEAGGQDHGKLMQGVRDNLAQKTLTVPKMLNLIEQAWYSPTAVATVRCDQVDGFDTCVKDFARRLMETTTSPEVIKKCFAAAQHMAAMDGSTVGKYDYHEVRDVVSVAEHVAASPEVCDAALKASARSVSAYVEQNLVTKCIVGDPKLADAHGVSIYAPVHPVGSFQQDYEQTPFHAATGWGEVVRKYSQA